METKQEEQVRQMKELQVLRLFRILKLFSSVGTKVVKHYIIVEVHNNIMFLKQPTVKSGGCN